MDKDTIEVSKERYETLINSAEFLNCLRDRGVEYWAGYEDAQEMYEETN